MTLTIVTKLNFFQLIILMTHSNLINREIFRALSLIIPYCPRLSQSKVLQRLEILNRSGPLLLESWRWIKYSVLHRTMNEGLRYTYNGK